MKHYNIKEYVKRYNQHPDEKYMNDYVLSLVKNTDLSEMIEFKEPYFLAGAFSNKFGLLTIKNCLKYNKKELKTQSENLISYLDYSEGYYSFDSLIRPKNEKKVTFVSGCYDKKTGKAIRKEEGGEDSYCFFVENIDDRSLTLNHPFLEKHEYDCNTSNLKTSDILETILSSLKNNKVEDVIGSIEKTLLTMKETTKGFFNPVTYSDPTYERPYRIRVEGNDDSSWSMCYATMEEAQEVRKAILANPCSETIDKYLVFTN